MLPYSFLMGLGIIAAFAGMFPLRQTLFIRILAWATLVFSWLLMTFRYRIGGDWFSYESIYHQVMGTPILEAIFLRDPGYMFINIISSRLGFSELWLVNGLGAFLLCWGIASLAFSRTSPNLALLSCIPYLIIVVGMGYARQAIALGLIMVALRKVELNLRVFSVLLIVLAASFHKTAIIMLPVLALCFSASRIFSVISALLFAIAGYYVFLQESMDRLLYSYIESGYSSGGALVRTLMLAICGTAYLTILRHRDNGSLTHQRLWTTMSISGILLFFAVFSSPSTTVIDRLGLYFLPLIIHVLGSFPSTFRPGGSRYVIESGIIILNILILLVWFSGAKHLSAWLPYRSYISSGVSY